MSRRIGDHAPSHIWLDHAPSISETRDRGTATADPIDPDPNDADMRTFTRSWTIQDDVVEAGVISIAVQVNWIDELGVARVVQLESLKANL